MFSAGVSCACVPIGREVGGVGWGFVRKAELARWVPGARPLAQVWFVSA